MNVPLSYQDYLILATARYERLSSDEHPGWGAVAGADVTIISTAEVMQILRAAGRRHDAASVRQGARAIVGLWEAEQAKGPAALRWTRQPTYAILGLTAFPELARVPAVSLCLKQARDALTEGFIRGCGWHDARPRFHADGTRLSTGEVTSIHQTAMCVLALEELGDGVLADAGRDVLVDLRGSDGTGPWWPKTVTAPQRQASHAITALAALALLGGREEHVVAAQAACRWLLSTHARWHRTVDDDTNVPGVFQWLHMTFSLGVRACLRAGHWPADAAVRASFDYMAQLWPAVGDEWQENPRGRRTVRASAAVVLAHEELRAAWTRADPLKVLRESTRQSRRDLPARLDVTLELDESMSVLIHGPGISEPTRVELKPAGWDVLAICSELLGTDQAVPLDSLEHAYRELREQSTAHRRAAHEGTGFSRALRRLEQTISDQTDGQVPHILERRRTTFRLAVTAVRVAPADALMHR